MYHNMCRCSIHIECQCSSIINCSRTVLGCSVKVLLVRGVGQARLYCYLVINGLVDWAPSVHSHLIVHCLGLLACRHFVLY